MTPLVSFVIPFYQQRDYIGEAVHSALAQTIGDVEVIAVDDGSTDGGADIVAAIDDKRLRLHRRANGGPSAALNDALRLAQGRYVAFLGGDDVAEPDRAASQIEYLENSNADIIFSLPTFINAAGEEINDVLLTKVFEQPEDGGPAAMFRRLIVSGNLFCAPSAFTRRDVIDQLGWFLNELIQLQDYDYWLRAAAAGYSFSVMSRKTTRYRRHAGNLSDRNGDNAVTGELAACLYRNLLEAPGDLLARAFPEIAQPGKASFDPLDRLVIALRLPLAREMVASSFIQKFLKESGAAEDSLSFDLLGHLIARFLSSDGPGLQAKIPDNHSSVSPYETMGLTLSADIEGHRE